MKKIYNILIILITSISVFAQSPNTGIVPSSVNDRSRIDPSEQLRKSVNPFEVLMTDANSKTMFWDTSHYKEILNLGRIDSLKQINDSTIVFYDRVNAVVDTVKIKVGAVDTDTRDSLSVVNDSLKVEVWDIINNTLLSTYYIDNVGNHPETITTLTNTIPNGNLIGTYTNEAGTVVNIKETLTAYNDQTTSIPHLIGKYLDEFGNLTDVNETLTSLNSTLSSGHLIGQYVNEANVGVTIKESIIKVDSITNGYVITKEDGNKDTIKINSTGFYTLTDISDTLALSAVAASKCPALSIAKLDSCNVAYLFMFNCEASHWELFKTPNIYTAGKTLFVDEVTGNDATAKKGCPTCNFYTPYSAGNSIQSLDNDLVKVNPGLYTFGDVGSGQMVEQSNINCFKNRTKALMYLDEGVTFNTNNKQRFIGDVGISPLTNIELLGYGNIINNSNGASIFALNNTGEQIKIQLNSHVGNSRLLKGNFKNIDVDINKYQSSAQFGFMILTSCYKSAVNIKLKDVLYNGGNSLFASNPFFSTETNATYYPYFKENKIKFDISNLEIARKYGNFFYDYVDENGHTSENNTTSCYISNIKQYNSDSLISPYGVYENVTASLISFGSTGVNAIFDNNKYYFDLDNVNIQYSLFSSIIQNTFNNCEFIIRCDNYIGDMPIFRHLSTSTYNNCKFIFEGNYINNGYPMIYIENGTFNNSKLIFKGNYSSDNNILKIVGGTFDATSVIELQGTFKTTSTTLPAIDINNNRLFLKDCDIITSGGYSIDSATPVNVTVKPGCASNVTTSSNVTQLGTGIYVDPNFNN